MINLKNQRFGFWIALEQAIKNDKNQTQWLCQCECGTQKLVTTNSLRTGNSTSCGCNKTPNLSKQKFGKLTVIQKDDSKYKGRRYWLCKCDCGTLLTINTYKLRNNKITSCGCDTQSISADIVSNTYTLTEQLSIYKENIDQIQRNCLLAQENYKIICDNYKKVCERVDSLSKLFSE